MTTTKVTLRNASTERFTGASDTDLVPFVIVPV